MTNDHPCIGDEGANLRRCRFNRLHAIVHVVRLTAALQLTQERIANQLEARLRNARRNRMPILWRRLDR